ncbi:hypothetical protein LG195_06465 [Proteus terrae]|uniref:hypothetical protein n=1 Tax=Proteus terrae TaxID=1574161 RepID=UPI00207CA17C|nr:hypothetical protein [Proteus terrae]MCO4182318.1 hypothetical protein [Proteus terrae]MCO4188689.1 hypothetical protein [Proteus terrae]UXA33663.1 hypothetical protein KZA80_15450 [Proteus terrae]
MILKLNNNSSSGVYVNNKETSDLDMIKNRLDKIENTHFSLFLSYENKGLTHKIIEKIKFLFNIKKKIGSINIAGKFNHNILLTDDICEKKVKDIDKIKITKEQLHEFIVDYNKGGKSVSFNWFVEQYVKTKGDLLLVIKIASYLENNKYNLNPLKLISNSSCPSNFLSFFSLVIIESTNKVKKEIFSNIIDDYFNKNKTNLESNEEVKRADFLLKNSYIIEWSDELKSAFKNIMENMINRNVDLNIFLKGVDDFELIDVESYFNEYGSADNYVKNLYNTIQQYITDYPRKDECKEIINYIVDSKSKINDYFEKYLNKIDGDLFMGVNKEQYLIRIGQIIDFFDEYNKNSEK